MPALGINPFVVHGINLWQEAGKTTEGDGSEAINGGSAKTRNIHY